MVGRCRIAILGGDGRFNPANLPGCRVRIFQGRRTGGNGSLRRLEDSIKAGGVDRVIILVRWNGHSVTHRIRQLCRRLGIPVEMRTR